MHNRGKRVSAISTDAMIIPDKLLTNETNLWVALVGFELLLLLLLDTALDRVSCCPDKGNVCDDPDVSACGLAMDMNQSTRSAIDIQIQSLYRVRPKDRVNVFNASM